MFTQATRQVLITYTSAQYLHYDMHSEENQSLYVFEKVMQVMLRDVPIGGKRKSEAIMAGLS